MPPEFAKEQIWLNFSFLLSARETSIRYENQQLSYGVTEMSFSAGAGIQQVHRMLAKAFEHR